MNETNELPLVLIEWVDAHGDGKWQELDGLDDRALLCRSVGWLVLDGENAKVVAPHMIEQEPGVPLQGCGLMTIPASSVVTMWGLTEGDGRAVTRGCARVNHAGGLRMALEEVAALRDRCVFKHGQDGEAFMEGANVAFGQAADIADAALADVT